MQIFPVLKNEIFSDSWQTHSFNCKDTIFHTRRDSRISEGIMQILECAREGGSSFKKLDFFSWWPPPSKCKYAIFYTRRGTGQIAEGNMRILQCVRVCV